jgi:hypothetical protein
MQLTQLTDSNFNRFTYFVCGPKSFMHAMKSILAAHDTEPDRIITEEFTPSSQENAVEASPKYSISKWTYSLSAVSLVLGTAFFMAIDISRALPKLVSAQASQVPATSQTSNTTSTNNNSSNPSSSNSNSTAQNPSSTNQQTTTQQSQNQYQTPVTSVS